MMGPTISRWTVQITQSGPHLYGQIDSSSRHDLLSVDTTDVDVTISQLWFAFILLVHNYIRKEKDMFLFRRGPEKVAFFGFSLLQAFCFVFYSLFIFSPWTVHTFNLCRYL